jgi:hypothetical protein
MLLGRSLMALQSHWSHQDAGERLFFWVAIVSTVAVGVVYLVYTSPGL